MGKVVDIEIDLFLAGLKEIDEKCSIHNREISALKEKYGEVPRLIRETVKDYFNTSIPLYLKTAADQCEIKLAPNFDIGGGVSIEITLPFGKKDVPEGFSAKKFEQEAKQSLPEKISGTRFGFFRLIIRDSHFDHFDLGYGCC